MASIKTKSTTNTNFETVNEVRTFTVLMDNMPEDGGGNYGATPKEHLCMALGSCTTMTIKTFLIRKNWPCHQLKADTKYGVKEKQTFFSVHITLKGNFDEKQQKRIKQIAKLCPIQKMLSAGSEIHETFEFISLTQ